MQLNPILRKFTSLLQRQNIEYVIVGAYALSFHGCPRYTDDLDIFLNSSTQNVENLRIVLQDFGYGDAIAETEKFGDPRYIFHIGYPPEKIDMLFRIPGVTFEQAWETRVELNVEGVKLNIIGREMFIQSKLAAGRIKDIADLSVITSKSEFDERTKNKK